MRRADPGGWGGLEGAAAGRGPLAAPEVHRQHGGHVCRQRPARRGHAGRGSEGTHNGPITS